MIVNHEIITKRLKDKNITPSFTRIQIYEYLARDKIHPTVDEIYLQLGKLIPSLSKTTVYNTLKLFVEEDLVKAVNLYDNRMRYELVRTEHGHFKCSSCDKVYDIPIDLHVDLSEELEGSLINEYHNLLIGICSHCINKTQMV